MANTVDASLSENLKMLFGEEVGTLGSRLYRLAATLQKHRDRPEALVRQILTHLDQLHYEVESFRSLVATSALTEGFSNEKVVSWLGVQQENQDRYTQSDWINARVAAARGQACPKEDVDSSEAYTAAKQTLEHASAMRGASNVAEVLALLYMWDYEADENSWLSERTARAVKHGWHIQPKRASPSARPSETEETKEAPAPLEAVEAA